MLATREYRAETPMAPKYAPSLRSRLGPLLFFLQIGFIVVYAFYIEINEYIDNNTFINQYSELQDVNVMVILGFGFLGTIFVRYGFSAAGFNLLVVAMATQWALILKGLESLYHRGKITISLTSLLEAELCTASALISMGAVHGKTNPVQLLIVALLEVAGFVLNGWLLQTLFKVQPFNNIKQLHVFGSFFGLMLTWVLFRKGSEQPLEKEKSDCKTGLFSCLGTGFMWIFWPSFNSALVGHIAPRGKLEAIYSTYLSMAVSAVTAAAVSALTSPQGKVNMSHLQRCSLAGGVAVGVSMSVVHLPWVAMTIGFVAAVVSCLGSRYLKAHMLAFECHDSCGVLSTHGFPGLVGWIAHLLLQIQHSDDPTMSSRFAVFHICTLLITLSLSLSMGLITGIILKWDFWRPIQDEKCFDDQAFWEFPHLAVHK